jgi:hypothetical protein
MATQDLPRFVGTIVRGINLKAFPGICCMSICLQAAIWLTWEVKSHRIFECYLVGIVLVFFGDEFVWSYRLFSLGDFWPLRRRIRFNVEAEVSLDTQNGWTPSFALSFFGRDPKLEGQSVEDRVISEFRSWNLSRHLWEIDQRQSLVKVLDRLILERGHSRKLCLPLTLCLYIKIPFGVTVWRSLYWFVHELTLAFSVYTVEFVCQTSWFLIALFFAGVQIRI